MGTLKGSKGKGDHDAFLRKYVTIDQTQLNE